ncbi:MAG: hypothetical protein OHK0024_36760 [Thalassobaculales bacterium]
MADDGDRAAALAQEQRDDGIAAARRALEGRGQSVCEDCGRIIPPARRRALPAATRCLACQALREG